MREVERAIDEDNAAAGAGQIPHTELMNRRRVHLNRLGEIERKYDALVNSESLIESMQADPVGFMGSFYEKWTALSDRLPSIDAWIIDDRQNRRSR